MTDIYQKYKHKIKHSLQSGCCLKRVLLGICVGLLLSGCVRDFVTAPFWFAKEVAGGARAHLPIPKLTEAEKAILDKNIARLIEQIKWIDKIIKYI